MDEYESWTFSLETIVGASWANKTFVTLQNLYVINYILLTYHPCWSPKQTNDLIFTWLPKHFCYWSWLPQHFHRHQYGNNSFRVALLQVEPLVISLSKIIIKYYSLSSQFSLNYPSLSWRPSSFKVANPKTNSPPKRGS